jgi:hypothetical protein
MPNCIICRKNKSNDEFNDEHVIQDSIGGYYHINSVCKKCNSNLGTDIDSTLTNHKFSEFQRFLLNIKGKKGTLPNPLKGIHTSKDDPAQRIQLKANKDGILTPYILPNIPEIQSTAVGENFTIILDKKDENQLDKILDKIAKRNGIPRNNLKVAKRITQSEKPEIKVDFDIDTDKFKIGLLKIAYEFCVDSIPSYYDDEKAILISCILKNADFEKLRNADLFIGTGLENFIPPQVSQLIDVNDKNHYLILTNANKFGLICFIKLFNIFSIAVKMSDNQDLLVDDMIVGINDFDNKKFVKLNAEDLIDNLFTPIGYRFNFWVENHEIEEFKLLQKSEDYDYFKIGDDVPFFNKSGEIVYQHVDDKLVQPTLTHKDLGDYINEIITEIELDEDLYLKLLPNKKLYKVVSVRIEQYRKI